MASAEPTDLLGWVAVGVEDSGEEVAAEHSTAETHIVAEGGDKAEIENIRSPYKYAAAVKTVIRDAALPSLRPKFIATIVPRNCGSTA